NTYGGGISIAQEGTIVRTTITHNSSGYNGGGIRVGQNSAGHYYSLTIIDSTISENTAYRVGGGIVALGNILITGSTISNNRLTLGAGGGVFGTNNIRIENSLVVGNTCPSSGGGIYGGEVTI